MRRPASGIFNARRAMALPREVHTRELLVEAHADVRVRLVVAQPDVELRAMALDELLLGQQRLGLGLRDEEVDRAHPADEVEAASVRPREVRGDPLADRGRLADIEHAAVRVLEHVDARRVGQLLSLLVEAVWLVRHT